MYQKDDLIIKVETESVHRNNDKESLAPIIDQDLINLCTSEGAITAMFDNEDEVYGHIDNEKSKDKEGKFNGKIPVEFTKDTTWFICFRIPKENKKLFDKTISTKTHCKIITDKYKLDIKYKNHLLKENELKNIDKQRVEL